MTNLNLKIKDQPPADENLGSFYMGRMRPSQPPRRILPRGALTFTTLFAFAAIIWYAYPRGQERYSDIDIPVISADKAVYKFKPDDPGGMEVLHQDSTVFDPLEKKSPDTVEKVRPKPEEPMVKPEAAKTSPIDKTPHTLQLQEVSHGSEKIIAAPPEEKPAPVKKEEAKAASVAPVTKPVETAKADVKVVKVEAAKVDVKASAVKTEAAKAAPVKTESLITQLAAIDDPAKGTAVPAIESVNSEPLAAPKEEATVAKPAEVAKPVAKTEAKPVAAKTAAKPAATGSATFVQFGAYRDDKGAREEWARLSKQFPAQLKGLTMRTEQAAGAKGTLTRLQAGKLTDARAKQICDALKAGKAACIIVHE